MEGGGREIGDEVVVEMPFCAILMMVEESAPRF